MRLSNQHHRKGSLQRNRKILAFFRNDGAKLDANDEKKIKKAGGEVDYNSGIVTANQCALKAADMAGDDGLSTTFFGFGHVNVRKENGMRGDPMI